ncbi:MAG: hypothetical protein WC816_00085 [Sphingomonas sp.]
MACAAQGWAVADKLAIMCLTSSRAEPGREPLRGNDRAARRNNNGWRFGRDTSKMNDARDTDRFDIG